LIAAVIDWFFAKDLWVEITPEVFTFCLETKQLTLKTIIWIQKSRRAVLAVGEELSRGEIEQNGLSDDIQRVDVFPAHMSEPRATNLEYLEAFFRFAFTKIQNRNVFARPKVHFIGIDSLPPQMARDLQKKALEQAAWSAGASAVFFVTFQRQCKGRLTSGLRRIFDPLASLAGLVLSALIVSQT
jgi:hypothetical protein